MRIFRFLALTCLSLLIGLTVYSTEIQGADADPHVYYGYVPVSTDAGWPGGWPGSTPQVVRTLNDVIDGQVQAFISPEGTALLDIVGIDDGTQVEIWDILAQEMLASKTVNRLEKWTYYIKFGTFFKVVSTSRVAVFLSGGYCMWAGFHEWRMGAETFYPCSDAGFVGNDFVFMSSMCSNTYIAYKAGSNLYVAALEESDIEVVSPSGKSVLTASLDQYGVGKYFLNVRIGLEQPTFGGGGDSIMFHLKSTGKIVALAVTSRTFTAVPSVTGGFVGRLFYAPVFLTIEEPGAAAAFVVVPIEPSEVTVYDSKFKIVDRKVFSQADIDDKAYWFKNMGSAKDLLIFKSTGDMTVMAGCTYLGATSKEPGAEDLGDDITFLGAKANQELRFYVPSSGVVFSSKKCSAIIDDETKSLEQDEFVLLDPGVHSVKADAETIIQILSAGHPAHLEFEDPVTHMQVANDYFWTDWGSYLVSIEDVNVSVEVPGGFGEAPPGGMDILTISVVVVVIGVGAAAGLFLVKKRRKGS